MAVRSARISNIWLSWFNDTKNILGMEREIEALDRLIEMEKEYPYKGKSVYKMMITKKILLQSKIRRIGEGSVING